MKVKVVSTCSAAGFKSYGKQMAATFSKFWPSEIRLVHYVEGFEYWPASDNIELRQLPQWFAEWKRRHSGHLDAHGLDERRNRPGKHERYDFRRDCVKFAHKIAALTDAGNDDCDLLIWMDADVIAHQPVTGDWLNELFPDSRYMAWLYRKGTHPECGFMMFRPGHEHHAGFMQTLRDEYESDRVFKHDETHDSYVIQKLVDQQVADGTLKQPFDLCGKIKSGLYVFHYSRLGERLDHAKGKRKKHGRTPKEEISGRKEAHWQ